MDLKDRYEIVELLGAGGMGQVYRAYDPHLDREVALKILRGDEPALRERAQREARHQARVEHQNVVAIYEVGELGGKPCVAMQLVEGRTLDAVAPELGLETRVALMRQVAEGVQAAHSKDLVHRDLKPANVLVERRGEAWHPWVADFGLAFDPSQPGITGTGAMVGTPAYMAPEQVRTERHRLDRRTDVYALGATLFQVLTGRPPFEGSPVEVAMQVLSADPPRLAEVAGPMPEELELIVGKCLEKDPERRYPSARLLAEDLERFLRGEPVLARAPSLAYRVRKLVLRHRLLASVLAVSSLAVLALAADATRIRLRAGSQARVAQELGREAERIASALRIEEMAPAHDLADARRGLRRAVERLEGAVEARGAAARGPGYLAAGEALLALGDPAAAILRLERALAGGYRDARLLRALGRARGELFLDRRRAIRRLGETWRESELERARRELLEPASRVLAEAAALAGPARWRIEDQAFAALLEGDLEEAEGLAARAAAADPWNHDVHRLLGDVRLEAARQAFEGGARKDALARLDLAGAAFAVAASIGRSDPEVERARCELAEVRLEAELLSSLPVGEDLEALLPPCDRAVALDSSSAASRTRRSALRRHLAARALRAGGDPAADLELAIRDGEAALGLDGGSWEAAYHTGVAYSLRANHAAAGDAEVEADLGRAGELLAACVAAEPAFVPCRVSRGVNGLELGIHLDNIGRDAEDAFRRAIAVQEEAISLAPDVAVLHNNLAYTRVYLAEVLLGRGRDPGDLLRGSRGPLDRARELAPGYATPWNTLGESHRVEAVALRARGEDPLGAARAAHAAYQEALALDADRFHAALRAAETLLLAVEFRLDRFPSAVASEEGRPEVEEALDLATAALRRAEEIAEETLACERIRLETAHERLGAPSLALPGLAAEDLLERAEAADCPLERVQLLLLRAAGEARKGGTVAGGGSYAAQGLALVERYLDGAPGVDWRSRYLAGALRSLQRDGAERAVPPVRTTDR